MATSADTELSEFIVNDVASDELAEELAESGVFEDGQFVITPDEDSDNVIYDMTSTDSSKNWGYTGGIPSGTEATNNIMSNYHFLDIVITAYPTSSVNTGGWSRVLRLDITSLRESDWAVGGYAMAYSDAGVAGYVNKETWNIVVLYNTNTKKIQCRCSFNGGSYTPNNLVYISRIYGVN